MELDASWPLPSPVGDFRIPPNDVIAAGSDDGARRSCLAAKPAAMRALRLSGVHSTEATETKKRSPTSASRPDPAMAAAPKNTVVDGHWPKKITPMSTAQTMAR